MARASSTPGPGAYKIKNPEIHGGTISKSEIPSDADVIAKRAEKFLDLQGMLTIFYDHQRKTYVGEGFQMQNR